MPLDIVILAAGQGTRMASALPKVLHPLAGRPLVRHVIDTAQRLAPRAIHVVTGHGSAQVRAALEGLELQWALQEPQLGTGHAVQQAAPALAADGITLVLYADVPLVRESTLRELVALARSGALALLTIELPDPTGYGRILRDAGGAVTAIVEQRDATAEQRAVREINTGIMAIPTARLKGWLDRLGNANAQGEYYLTDVVAMAVADGIAVRPLHALAAHEVAGVNTRAQLAALERAFQSARAEELMLAGISLADPARFDLRGELVHGRDIDIDVNVVIEGRVEIGAGVRIGPNCLIRDSRIAAGVTIHANSVVEGAEIGPDCNVGPFARLRPGTRMAAKARIGNFVETKKADIGRGSKINHLSYVGDAELGDGVNIGAGTITCNYDGVNKYKTTIGSGAFIGSNTALVAPVEVGADATVGAGSVITDNVPPAALGVARGKQRNISGWKRPVREDGH